jgi:hypothetical protein
MAALVGWDTGMCEASIIFEEGIERIETIETIKSNFFFDLINLIESNYTTIAINLFDNYQNNRND